MLAFRISTDVDGGDSVVVLALTEGRAWRVFDEVIGTPHDLCSIAPAADGSFADDDILNP